ncbi:outer membrane protein assembly factor BamD [Gammaproteobacteria bacterium]|nr:outer membrane protein assembly factor BamD [Gammaproteobacteria bacterium]
MKKKIRAVVVFSIVLPLVFLTSCNSDGPGIEKPEKIYYDLAQRRMKANNFFSAIESLEAIEARYPFGRYAEQAQSELIYAYFMNGEDEASHEAAEKFIRLNPRHPNIDYAYFMRGIASYTRDKGMFARVFKSDLSNRDSSGAKQAFSELSEFLTRFPQSQYAPYASQRLIYLRSLIAKSELVAADYYMKRKAYVAALRRAKYVIENIPNTSQTMRALKIVSECYKELGYFDLMNDVNAVIEINKGLLQEEEPAKNTNFFSRNAPSPST